MHESKGQHIGKPPSQHLFHTTVWQHPWELNLPCSYYCCAQVFKLSFTHWLLYDQSAAHSSSGSRLYQRHVPRVPLSIKTYNSGVKIHGMVLASSQLVARFRKTSMHCLTAVWKRCRDGGLPICWPLLSCIIPTLFAHFLACHPYIFLHF